MTNEKAPANNRGSLILSVAFGVMGNSRKISSKLIDTDADKSMLNLNKRLLESPELDAIKAYDSKTRAYIYSKSLPGPLKDGMYNVPMSFIAEADDFLLERQTGRDPLIGLFMQLYLDRVGESITRLASLGKKSDYKTPEAARKSFYMTWNWLGLDVPTSLKEISQSLFEREKDKLRKVLKETEEVGKQAMRQQVVEMVDRVVSSLGGEDGKQKRFYASNITNIEEFLETFDKKDLANDRELREATQKLKRALTGMSVERIRDDSGVREYVKQEFEKVQEIVKDFVIDTPERMVNL